jgi:hypothetical protein
MYAEERMIETLHAAAKWIQCVCVCVCVQACSRVHACVLSSTQSMYICVCVCVMCMYVCVMCMCASVLPATEA